MTTKERGHIEHSGMGGFLNPPGHPEHTHSVSGKDFSMSLSSAVECDWLDEGVRRRAKAILNAWKAPPIVNPEIEDWIQQVLGYFRGCYSGQDKAGNQSWNASDLRIDQKADPVLNQDIHAGVHFIRKYYPEYIATALDFESAYWGTKTDKVIA